MAESIQIIMSGDEKVVVKVITDEVGPQGP